MKSYVATFLLISLFSLVAVSCQRKEETVIEQTNILPSLEVKEVNFQELAKKKAKELGKEETMPFIEEVGDIKGSYKKLTGKSFIFYFDKNGKIMAIDTVK